MSKGSTVPLYKDLGKKANDLITRGFPTSGKVKFTTTSENGLKFETVVERKGKYSKDGLLEGYVGYGAFTPKLELKDYGLKVNATLDTEWVKGEVVLSDLFTDGLEFVIKTKAKKDDVEEASGDLYYKQEGFNLALSIFNKKNATKASLSSVLGHEGIVIGGQVVYKLGEGDSAGGLDSLSISTGYIAGKFDIIADVTGTAEGDESGFKVKVGTKVFYKHSDVISFSTKLCYAVDKSFADGVTVSAADSYSFDKDTSVKAKVDTNGVVGLAYAQSLNPNLKLSLGAEVNTLKSADNKFGFELAFTP